jgi:hypothetical protein
MRKWPELTIGNERKTQDCHLASHGPPITVKRKSFISMSLLQRTWLESRINSTNKLILGALQRGVGEPVLEPVSQLRVGCHRCPYNEP